MWPKPQISAAQTDTNTQLLSHALPQTHTRMGKKTHTHTKNEIEVCDKSRRKKERKKAEELQARLEFRLVAGNRAETGHTALRSCDLGERRQRRGVHQVWTFTQAGELGALLGGAHACRIASHMHKRPRYLVSFAGISLIPCAAAASVTCTRLLACLFLRTRCTIRMEGKGRSLNLEVQTGKKARIPSPAR